MPCHSVELGGLGGGGLYALSFAEFGLLSGKRVTAKIV